MKKFIKRAAAIAAAAGMLPIFGCAQAADYSENTGGIDLSLMSVTGSGISVDGKTITITEGGDFNVTGEAADAIIYVNAADKVKLRLSGMKLKNTDGPAIFFDNAEKALVTITQDTENYLEDGTDYSADYEGNAKAALFSNDDLEIKGGGSLTVVGNHAHAIASDDDISIENGTINITSGAKDGIHANNDIDISGGSITVASEKQGFQAEENFIQSGGSIIVSKCTEGIESGASITISGGETDITSSDDGLNSGGGSGGGNDIGGGQSPMMRRNGRQPGGDFNPDSTQPPMHEGDRTQPGGDFNPDSAQPPMHGDNQAQPGEQSGDRGRFKQQSEMPDGGFGGPHGENASTADSGVDSNIYISGGTIRINAEGDGVDSNSGIIMTGGELYIDGPENSGNGAIDCLDFNVSGGTVTALGAAGMAMGVTEGSEQCGILINTDTIKAGSVIELKDGDTVIMSCTPKKDISSVTYSSDKLKEGAQYTLYANGEAIETVSMTEKQTTAGEQSFGGFHRGGAAADKANINSVDPTNPLNLILKRFGISIERSDSSPLGFEIKLGDKQLWQ